MADLHGYHGKVLRIDLSSQMYWTEPINSDVLRLYVGGVGLATWLLYQYCPAGIAPLDPANPLIFVTSPLVGSSVTTSSKFAVAAKSPLTGFIGDSLSSSHLAVEIKAVGVDAIVVTGQASGLSAIFVTEDSVRFLDAADLAGLSSAEASRNLVSKLGDTKARVAAIGPAGETGVLYATISNDGRHAGRTGLGAVMGAKRLKAIAVRGRRTMSVADPSGLQTARRLLADRSLGPATAKYRLLGTTANVAAFDRLGVLPSRNFRQSTFAGADEVSGERLRSERHTKSVHCANCTVGCEQLYRAGDGKSSRLEYETLYALGPLVGVDDPDLILRAARRCDDLGIDTISAGVTLAWAMECVEKGLLGPSDLGPLSLRFGDGQDMLAALDAIGRRQGLGDLLAEGTRRASRAVGGGSERWAMHVKGLEMPGYEPRGLKTLALGLATSPRGACHNRSSAYEIDLSSQVDRFGSEPGRGALAAASEDYAAVMDSLVLCKFIRHCLADFYPESAELLNMVTGFGLSGDDLRIVGERVSNLKKHFNEREGWARSDDTLPPRILEEAVADGVGAGTVLTRTELEAMIADYYQARGWSPDGRIPPERLEILGIR